MADAMFGFCKSNSNIPISHLDYKYIGGCNDPKELENLLKILRSGEDGLFPDLIKFTEEKLEKIFPKSKLLQKETKVKMTNELHKDERTNIMDDLMEWTNKITSVDKSLFGSADQSMNDPDQPPIRKIIKNEQIKQHVSVQKANKNVAPRSYSEWDKIDVESEVKRVDESINENSSEKARIHKQTNPIPENIKLSQGLPKEERIKKGNLEKEKGNEAFRAGDYDEALIYYGRSLSLYESASAYNNRAITYIKMEKFELAIIECNTVLKLEPDNVKAFLRRGIASKSLKRYEKAFADFSKVLELAPTNKRGQELFEETKKILKDTIAVDEEEINTVSENRNINENFGNKSKGKRMIIEEIDTQEDKKNDIDKKESETKKKGKRLKIIEVEDTNEMLETYSHSKLENRQEKIERNDKKSTLLDENNVKGVCNGKDTQLNGVIEADAISKKSPSTSRNGKNETDQTCKENSHHKNKAEEVDIYAGKVFDTKETAKSKEIVTADSNGASPGGEKMSIPVPDDVLQIKNEGNDLYKAGRYAEAEMKYSEAIEKLRKADKGHDQSLAVLLSNRATCKLKIGDCKGCVKDATESLNEKPTAKAFLKRAGAYEMLENYRYAYIDYQSALRMDNTLQAAWSASARLSKLLRNRDGAGWMEHLPKSQSFLNLMQYGTNYSNNVNMMIAAEEANSNEQAKDKKDNVEKEGTSKETEKETKEEPPETDKKEIIQNKEEEFKNIKEAGNKFVQKKEYDEAIKCYTECIELFPDEVACYSNRSLCYLKLEQHKNAESDATIALGIQNDNVKALYRRALARKALGKYEDAVDDLKSLLQIDNMNTAAKKELDLMKRKLTNQSDNVTKSKTKNALNEERNGKNINEERTREGMKSMEEENVNVKPDENGTDMKKKGKKLKIVEVEDFDDIEKIGKRPSAETEDVLGKMKHEKTGNKSKVDNEATVPETESIKINDAEQEKKKLEMKEEKFNRVKELGHKCLQEGNFHGAANYYSQCIDLFPNQAASYTNRAFCYLKLHKLKKAENDCSKALEIQPNNIQALLNRALARKASRKYKDALQDLTLLLKVDPQNGKAKTEMESVKELWRTYLKNISAKQHEISKPNSETEKKSKKNKSQNKDHHTSNASAAAMESQAASSHVEEETSQPTIKQMSKESIQRGPRKINLKKASGFEFLKAWNEVKGKSLKDHADLLIQIEPSQLPKVISNKIDAEMIQTIVSCVYEQFFTKDKLLHGFNILKYTSKAERFNMGILFLSTNDLSKIRRVVEELAGKIKDMNIKVTAKEMMELRRSYKAL